MVTMMMRIFVALVLAFVGPLAGLAEGTMGAPDVEVMWDGGAAREGAADDTGADKVELQKENDGPVREGSLVSRAGVDADVLSGADARAYEKMLKEARAGKAPDVSRVKDDVLVGYVRGAYLLSAKHNASFGELNAWLKDNRDVAMAGEIYKLAEAKRARPKQVCTTKKVKQKIKTKKGKTKTVSKPVKTCHTEGEWGPMPLATKAMEDKERKQAAAAAAQRERLAGMSESGRKLATGVWRARSRGDFDGALEMLTGFGAKSAMGSSAWQGEMVKVASFYHGKRQWEKVAEAAEAASKVSGPERDEALWLAGFANYRMGNRSDAADYWSTLVKEEPEGGAHHARAAWWAARLYSEMGSGGKARALLEAGAKDRVGFYGQLCAAKLGSMPRMNWGVPAVNSDDVAKLKRVPVVHRALALAQVGEVDFAQKELRAGRENIPYQLERALAAVAVEGHLPGIALSTGKSLLERGELVASALFPVPEQWEPKSGSWTFDRALMTGIMRQESAFQPSIGSWVGAQGLMQIMPATGAYIARMRGERAPSRGDLHNPGTNLELAQTYLRYLTDKLDGNLMMVVAAYNGGVGNVQRWVDRGVTPSHDPVLWMESIPFDETRGYVEKVFANYWIYQQRMGKKAWSLQAVAEGGWPVQNGGRAEAASSGFGG